MKRTFIGLMLLLSTMLCHAQYFVESPNRDVRVNLQSNRERTGLSKFTTPQQMTMKVSIPGEVLVNKEVGLTVKTKGRRHNFGKSDIMRVNKQQQLLDAPDNIDSMLVGLKGRYNTLMLATAEGIVLELRAYNNGVAYRFKVMGIEGDYKILNFCDVFNGEKPVAIEGTFEGTYTSAWSTLIYELSGKPTPFGKQPKAKTTVASARKALGTRYVPWRDALSSITIGTSLNSVQGDTWGDVTDYHTLNIDLTYKHLFTGIGLYSCNSITYINWGESFWPFEGVMKDIQMWSIGARAGYVIPIQNGYEMWSFIPYVATTLMHLHQHGTTPRGAKALSHHAHWMVGPGVKVQLSERHGFTLAAGYEFQFFTDNLSPTGVHAFSISLGKTF